MTSSLTVGPAFYGCYLLHSDARRANRHYIGSTPDPARRLRQHNGLVVGGAKKTRAWRPWEMQLLIYGFTSKLSALQFEWAWQHPDKTRHLAGALGPKAHQGGAAQKVLVARKLMTVPPFAGQPLHVLAFSERYGALFLSAGGGSGGGGAKGGRGGPKKSKTKTTTTSKPPSPLPPPPPPGGRSRRSGPAASQGGQGPRRREEEGGVRGPLLPEGVAQEEEEEEDGLLPLRPLATVRLRIEGVDGRRGAVIGGGGGGSRFIQQRGQPASAPSKGRKTTRSTAATGSKRNRKGTRTETQDDDDEDRGENKGGGGDRGDQGEGEVDESDSHGGGLGPLQVDDGSFARAHWEKYERFLDSLTGPAAAAAACDPAVSETTTTTGAVDGRTSTDDLTTASSAAKQPPPLDELAVGPTTPCCTLCSRSVDLSKPGTFVLCPSSADPGGSDAAGGDGLETDHARLSGGRSFFPSPCPPLFPSVSSPRAVSTTADGGNADGRGGAREVVLSTTGPCQALTHLTCLARHFLTAPNPACSTLQRPLASTSALTGPPTPSTTTTTTTSTTVAAIGTALTSRSSPAPARLVPLEGTCPACTEPQEWGVVVRSLWAIGRGRQGEFDPDLQRTGWRGGRGGGRRPRKLEGKGKGKAVHETTDEASDDDDDDDGRLSVADSVTAEATAATGGTTTGAESDEAADEDAVQYTAGRTSRRKEQEQQHSPPTQAASHKERRTTGRGRGVNAIDTARSLADRLRFPNRKRRAASSSSSSPANETEDDNRADGEDLPALLASATIRTPSPSKASAEKRARRRRPTGGAPSSPSGEKRAVGGPTQSDEQVKRVHKGWLGGPSPMLDVSPPKASSRVKGKAKERAGTGDDEWEVLADDNPSDLVTPRPSKLTRTKPLAAASSQGRPIRLGTAPVGSADAAQSYLSIGDESDDNFPFDILPRSRRPPEPPTPSSALSDLVLTPPPSAAIASLAGPSDQLRPAPAAGRKRPSLPLETDADLAPPAAKRQSPAQVPVSSRTAATAGKPKPLYVELSDSD